MYNAKNKIDPDSEINHLIEFVKNRWSDNGDLEGIMRNAWEMSEPLTKNHFDQYGFTDFVTNWIDAREKSSKWKIANEEKSLIFTHDSIYNFAYGVLTSSGNLYKMISEDFKYENAIKKMMTELKSQYEKTASLKPLGWVELAKNYNDFDGYDEYAKNQYKIDKKEFKGCNSNGASSGGFHYRVVLHNVMYDDKCQSRKPFEILIGAILAHRYFVSSHNNTLEIIKELNKVKDFFEQDIYYEKIQNISAIKENIEKITDNKFIKAMSHLKKEYRNLNDEEFYAEISKSVRNTKDYEKMTPEQKEERKKDSDKIIHDIMTSIVTPSQKEIDELNCEKKEQKSVCLNILGISQNTNKKKIKP